jgi:hypothetical protein
MGMNSIGLRFKYQDRSLAWRPTANMSVHHGPRFKCQVVPVISDEGRIRWVNEIPRPQKIESCCGINSRFSGPISAVLQPIENNFTLKNEARNGTNEAPKLAPYLLRFL